MQIRTAEDTPFLSDINMIPLIDVSLVLLIIFMIITPYMVLNSIQVQLPKSASAKQSPTKSVIVSIKDDGGIFLNNEPVADGKLTELIAGLMPKNPTGAVIFADKHADVATVVDVIDQIEAGGIHNVSLTTERKAR
jgi:biopolymer transport protein ExbD